MTNNILSFENKVKLILEKIVSDSITAYELAKNTGLNESGLNRFIKGEVKKPHKNTVNTLYNHLYHVSLEEKSTVNIPENNTSFTLTKEDILVVENAILLNEEELLQRSDIVKDWLETIKISVKIETVKKLKISGKLK